MHTSLKSTIRDPRVVIRKEVRPKEPRLGLKGDEKVNKLHSKDCILHCVEFFGFTARETAHVCRFERVTLDHAYLSPG